ncbi:hypothetical protein PGT21_003389 [Puccinia graminis f. sp. tritici]|uniref:Secreted protein n=1 Tax=Puccinia graminis f. sp. tritici TaxID=56615 RepID=A0A5B0MCK5_PUCGR|nr:hypothetical protein PGT21_003389 [Puccinia graminis f. sp. tritici]
MFIPCFCLLVLKNCKCLCCFRKPPTPSAWAQSLRVILSLYKIQANRPKQITKFDIHIIRTTPWIKPLDILLHIY